MSQMTTHSNRATCGQRSLRCDICEIHAWSAQTLHVMHPSHANSALLCSAIYSTPTM